MTDFQDDYGVAVADSVFWAVVQSGSATLTRWARAQRVVRFRPDGTAYATPEVASSFKCAFDLLLTDITNKPVPTNVLFNHYHHVWPKVLKRLEALAKLPKKERDLTIEALHVAIMLSSEKPSSSL